MDNWIQTAIESASAGVVAFAAAADAAAVATVATAADAAVAAVAVAAGAAAAAAAVAASAGFLREASTCSVVDEFRIDSHIPHRCPECSGMRWILCSFSARHM